MLQKSRLQWKIAWGKTTAHFCTVIWKIIVTVSVVRFIVNMGVKVKGKYTNVYIPFEHVLKKNYLLQEEVSNLSQELKAALNLVSEYEQKMKCIIFECNQQTLEMQRQVDTAGKEVKQVKDRVETFEGIVKQLGSERSKNQTMRQEKVRLAVQLKDSEKVISDLQNKLQIKQREYDLATNSKQIEENYMNERIKVEDCSIKIDGEVLAVCDKNSSVESSQPMGSLTEGRDGAIITESSRHKELSSRQALCSSMHVSRDNYNRCCEREDNITHISLDNEESTDTEDDNNSNTTFSETSFENSFVDDDGVEYIRVPRDSMCRQYILLKEDENETWFEKTVVFYELFNFTDSIHMSNSQRFSVERREKLNSVIDELRKCLSDEEFLKANIFDEAFIRFYEITEGSK